MSDQIKPGDTVELKSGGPTMTVAKVVMMDGVQKAVCDWFLGGVTHQSGSFPLTSLKHAEE